MAKKERYAPVFSPQEEKELFDWVSAILATGLENRKKMIQRMKEYIAKHGIDDFLDAHIQFSNRFAYDTEHLNEKKHKIVSFIKKYGIDRFLCMLIDSKLRNELETYTPDSKLNPELEKELEKLTQSGYSTENLEVSLIGDRLDLEGSRLRIEIPLSANIKDYLKPVLAFQKYFIGPKETLFLVKYFVDEHGHGRTYQELAEELNNSLESYFVGKAPALDDVGLYDFIQEKKITAENYKPFSAENIRSIVKYYDEKRRGNS